MTKITEVNCPTCSKKVTWQETSTFRPFCSDRCQQIDLGSWADESFSIPAEIKDEWELADQQAQIENAINSSSNNQHH